MTEAKANPFLGSAGSLNGEAPVAVRAIDLDRRARSIDLGQAPGGRQYRRLLALMCDRGRPLGWVVLPVGDRGRVSLEELPARGRDAGRGRGRRARAREDAGGVLSVVVATCADARASVRCVEAILAGSDAPLEVVVVENRPRRSQVRAALERTFAGDRRVRFLEERRRGLSAARNAGLEVVRGELVAFTDDDVLVDRGWARAIRAAFADQPDAACVTGLIAPLELETPTQLLVERFASFGKGFQPRCYRLADAPADQPLFPYTAGHFGSGANMAFRTSTLRELGGFDPALGTGTPARGGEDLDVCIRLLHAGGGIAYEPSAIVWHRHVDRHAALRRQAFDYGAGLGAMLSKQLLRGPARLRLLARAPAGLRYFADPRSRKNALRGRTFPAHITWLERAGLAYGPLAYLASRTRAWL